MTFGEDLSTTTLALVAVLVVIIFDRVWHIPAAVHPLTLFRLLVINLGNKVLPADSPEGSPPKSQHYISGTLGIGVLILPLLVVVGTVFSFAEFQWFFDAITLFVCVNFYPVRRNYKRVIQSLTANKKYLAREKLATMVARQTDNLSDIGIAKAAMESYLLHFYQQFVGVLFWFLVLGPLGALGYRLLLEFRRHWHRRRPNYALFARPAYLLSQWLIAPAYILGALLTLLVSSPFSAIQSLSGHYKSGVTTYVLALFGGGMGFTLGGPAFYFAQKYRDARVGGERQVRLSDLTYTLRAINRATWLLVFLLTLWLLVDWQISL